MREIILASSSPRRAELLKQIGVQFRITPSDITETVDLSLTAEEIAKSLAYQKAFDVSRKVNSGALVLGADTIVVSDGVLGKPQTEEDALEMLRSLRGKWHSVITGISIIDTKTMKNVTDYEQTRVKVKDLTDQTIRAYIQSGEPMDKAGAYGIQGLGALLVERIEGCYFNVVGLPVAKLSDLLAEFGVVLLE